MGKLTNILILLVNMLFGQQVSAQIFGIDQINQINNDIVIRYTLTDTIPNRAYTIHLYSSTDDFINPLEQVEGDIGLEVKPGGNRKITWHIGKEFGSDFKGSVGLEVRGRIYIPFIRLDGFDDYKKFKRGKEYQLTWTGGRGNQLLNFNLYKGEDKVATYTNVANVGAYTLKFEQVKPGKNYYFKIVDTRNSDETVITETFKIRRKVPLAVTALPVMAAGYLGYSVFSGETLPDPIPEPLKPE